MHAYTNARILLLDQILANLSKSFQSLKFIPCQYFVLYGTQMSCQTRYYTEISMYHCAEI